MRKVLNFLRLSSAAIVFLLKLQVAAQKTTPFDFIIPMTENVSADSLSQTILDLQSFVSRFSINENRLEIAHYLKNRLQRYGCEVYLDTFVMISPYDGRSLLQYNVIGKIQGHTTDDAVLIGAHYDACCRADSSPGADDNASGVAAVIEAARILHSQMYQPRKTTYFCAWAAEEQGLLGSRDFSNKFKYSNQKLALAINLDMIANSPDTLLKVKFESSPSVASLAKFLSQLNGTLSFEEGQTTENSDHASFRSAGFPIVYYHEYSFSPYYHSAKDLFVHLNMAYCKRISQAAISTLIGFSALPPTPTFIYAGNSGTGTGVSLAWQPIPSIQRFRVEFTGNNILLLDTIVENQNSLRIEGFSSESLMVNLYALDSNGMESLPISRNVILNTCPEAVRNLSATADAKRILLSWSQPSELDLRHFLILQRPYFSTATFDTIARIAPSLTQFEVFPPNSEPLAFKVIALDSAGNYGFASRMCASALARYDRGLLVVVDATSNSYGLSADSIKNFFSAINQVVPTTVLKAPLPSNMPNIYNAYRMVLWHSTVAGLSQKLALQLTPLQRFMDGGGALMISTDYPQKLLSSANNPTQTYYPIDPVRSFLRIEQTGYISGGLMQKAIGGQNFPTLRVDSTKVTANNGRLNNFCELTPVAPMIPIYWAYNSDDDNPMNGKSIAIFSAGNPALAVLAFPLAFMVFDDVKELISHLYQQGFQSIVEATAQKPLFLELYPNPVSDILNLRLISDRSTTKVSIYSILGELMGEYVYSTPSPLEVYQVSISVESFPSGIYFLRLDGKTFLFVKHR